MLKIVRSTFWRVSVDLQEIKQELDGRTVREALQTAGIRLKEHFQELDLVKGHKIDIEALKKTPDDPPLVGLTDPN